MAKPYLALFAASLLLPLAVVAAVNFTVDVQGVYAGEQRQRQIGRHVDALLSSPAGVVASPFERQVKLDLARRAPADCFVTGSSHEMQIGLDVLVPAQGRCRSLINLAVSGGAFEDLLTQLGVLADRQDLRAVYVGVAPWSLRHGADVRWTQVAQEYRRSRARLGLSAVAADSAVAERLANLVNGRYFARNIEQLWAGGWRHDDAAPLVVAPDGANLADDQAVTAPDGSHRYSRRYLAAMPPPPAAIGDGGYKIAQPYVAAAAVAELEQALTVLVRRGVQVVFVLSPYHPQVMHCSNPRVCSAFDAVEAAVRALAGRLGGEVVGGFDPRPFGLSAADFYDEMHMARSAVPRLR